jgi:hypothetical protein
MEWKWKRPLQSDSVRRDIEETNSSKMTFSIKKRLPFLSKMICLQGSLSNQQNRIQKVRMESVNKKRKLSI